MGGTVEISLINETGLRRLDVDDLTAALERDSGIVWIDLSHDETAGMRLLTTLFQTRTFDVDDCHTRMPVPKLHAYRDHYYSAINGLARGCDGRLYFQPLKVFFNPGLLVTVMGPTSESLPSEAARRLLGHIREKATSGELTPDSAFELVSAIRFEMLRTHEALLAEAAARAGELEKRLLGIDPVKAETVLAELFELRHDLQTIRTNAAQTHELYVHLIEVLGSQDDLLPLDLRRLNDLRLGFSHLRNTADLEREYLQEVLDLLQTRVSTELNRFVRKITAWGAIAIAWSVIVGIYGMNFRYMPELEWRFGYASTLGFLVLVGVVLAVMFRRRGWL
jgi:magnesium transporter